MIVKFAKPGQSFKGVVAYLTHDPDDPTTAARIAWTQTFNLANDDMQSAVHEMYTTSLNAEILKAEAGVRAGGRTTKKPVKHFSLSWHPSERPDKGEMIAATLSFLEHMGWDAHQAVLVSHDDKPHAHVHVVVNAIHPETGLKLDVHNERRRAQKWALAYQQERGQEFCPQRLLPRDQRVPSEPRPAWMAIKEHTAAETKAEQQRLDFDAIAVTPRDERRTLERNEWTALKALQREERLAFFAEGKVAYKDLHSFVYRQVRAEFRQEWATLYAAGRAGMEPAAFAENKTELIERQKAVFEERRKDAAAALRAERDIAYRALRDAQKERRGELTERQERGEASPLPLDLAAKAQQQPARENDTVTTALDRFGIKRGRGVTDEQRSVDRSAPKSNEKARASRPTEPVMSSGGPDRAERPPSRDLASGLAGGLLALIGGLGESLTGGPPPARPSPPEDALDRFGIRRGRPPPEEDKERARREARARDDDWWDWRRAKLDR